MHLNRIATGIMLVGALTFPAMGQAEETASALHLELNTVKDTGSACRLTFVANNRTGTSIEQAVFETVIFDTSGSVALLSLFDFRELPSDRPRVRQFDVPNISCDTLGQALINGANTCTVSGAASNLCNSSLSLSSRIAVELIG